MPAVTQLAAIAPAACLAELQAIALHADDEMAWRRIGDAVWPHVALDYRRCGEVLPGTGGLIRLPLDALPELARVPELEPVKSEDLTAALHAALAMLAATWPQAAHEVSYFVRAIIAGRLPAGRQSSGSSKACPFVVRIDFCIDDPSCLLAEALVHEASHVKLRLAGILETFCDDAGEERFHHPWRPEPRPLSAVCVACHAFVAVHGFHARRRALGLAEAVKIEAELRAELAQALKTLKAARELTRRGRDFADLLVAGFKANCQLADHQSVERAP